MSQSAKFTTKWKQSNLFHSKNTIFQMILVSLHKQEKLGSFHYGTLAAVIKKTL